MNYDTSALEADLSERRAKASASCPDCDGPSRRRGKRCPACSDARRIEVQSEYRRRRRQRAKGV